MDDIIGVIPGLNTQLIEPSNPFQNYSSVQDLDVGLNHLHMGQACFSFISNEYARQVYVEENLYLILHGACYTKVLDPTVSPRKLSPHDLLELFKRNGQEFLDSIKGSFVIIIWNKEHESILVINDHLNLRSVYYHYSEERLIISTSVSAIAHYLMELGVTLQVDRRSVMDRVVFDFILDDHTYIEGILELPPGSILKSSKGSMQIVQYFEAYKYFELSGPQFNRSNSAKLIADVLERNIQLYSEGPSKTALALTGGFDSRSIAALLGSELLDYYIFSYGIEGSWDLKIPLHIANKLNLNYLPITLGDQYRKVFPYFAEMAVLIGDGITEFSQANISYVYSQFLDDKTSILTGLFGSEMIKIPSSRGLYIDQNMIRLLDSDDLVASIKTILDHYKEYGIGLENYEDEMIESIRRNPFINNELPINEKYFYYLIMVGFRRYFSKEIKIQKVLKRNLHPFFDIDFLSTLLKTPYPWVYKFSKKKNLISNTSIHQLYASLISCSSILSHSMSTHGFRPHYLTSKLYLPLLAIEYLINKRRIRKATHLDIQKDLSLEYITRNESSIFRGEKSRMREILKVNKYNQRDFIKLSSLQYWLNSIGLSL